MPIAFFFSIDVNEGGTAFKAGDSVPDQSIRSYAIGNFPDTR
jgi:hypothetical protein